MHMRGPNCVGRAVQTDPTLLCYTSPITEQKKCWVLLVLHTLDGVGSLRTCSVLGGGGRGGNLRLVRLCKRLPPCLQHVNALLSPWRPYVLRVRGSNNAGRVVQKDPTLLRYASVIKILTSFNLRATTPNNTQ